MHRKRSSGKKNSTAPASKTYGEVKLESGGGGMYEDPDKLASAGWGNYELTKCPAYISTSCKLQPHPIETQSSH